jgi:flagellar hook-associated protein 1 FlgK
VLQGKTLATDINRLASRVGQIRSDLNDRIKGAASDINRLLEEVRVLNIRIAETEGGDVSASDAVGLRDQRNLALNRLAELIDIRVQEQPSGTVTIFSSGDYLVFEGVRREVGISLSADRGLSVAEIRIADIDAPLQFNAGEVAGLMSSRDDVLGRFLDQLDSFAGTLAFEFNKVFSSGQGLNGYQTLTSFSAVDSATAALDAAGLPFTPVNGSFQLQVHNKRTGLTQTTDIKVDLNGLDNDTSLTTLASALDAINGISASVSLGKLTITSDSSDQEFAFAKDTSGVLAALGINSFFTGSSARELAVASEFLQDPSKFAASGGGIAEDTSIAVELANFLDRPLTTRNGATLSVLYDQITGETTQASTVARAVAEGARVFEESLEGQHLAISGVSIDEEVVRMIQYQRAFQASAKYISTLSELLDILVNL